MIRTFIRWLAGKLLEWADPQFKAELAAYKAHRAEVEQQASESKQAIGDLQSQTQVINTERNLITEKQATLEMQTAEVERKLDETRNTTTKLTSEPDADLLRGDL